MRVPNTAVCRLLLLLPFALVAALCFCSITTSAVTIEEVQDHDSSDDCWSVLYDKVYDLTEYAPNHPRRGGGAQPVWDICGIDGTDSFDRYHGNERYYLEMFDDSVILIGDYEIEAAPAQTTVAPTTKPTQAPTIAAPPSPAPTEVPSTRQPIVVPTFRPITTIVDQTPSLTPTSTSTENNAAATEMPTTRVPIMQPTSLPTTTVAEQTSSPAAPAVDPNTAAPTLQSTSTIIIDSIGDNGIIDMQELAKHDNQDDCWTIYYDTVYNMTQYAYKHPGPGAGVIHRWCGLDGTKAYEFFHEEPLLSQVEDTIVGKAQMIDMQELSQHNNPDDCWVIYYNMVYDMTEYAFRHPGPGESVIHKWCGKDGTDAYKSVHEESLLSQVQDTIVGKAMAPTAPTTAPTPQPTNTIQQNNGNNEGISMQELAEHDNPDDCWVLYYDKVYDMTEYAYDHPGPRETVIHPYCGKDGTVAYAAVHEKSYLSRFVQDTIVGDAAPALVAVDDSGTPAGGSVGIVIVATEELLMHDNPNDCWVVFYGDVYNMTQYAYRHPGPAELAIHPHCGADGTTAYDIFHAPKLLGTVADTKIGVWEEHLASHASTAGKTHSTSNAILHLIRSALLSIITIWFI